MTEKLVLMSPTFFAAWSAGYENRDRNWRRVKREINKAMKRAKNTKG